MCTTHSVAAIGAALLLAAAAAPAADFAGGRSDHFESEMNVILTVPGLGTQPVALEGPVTVVVGERREEGGVGVVDTEIVAMELEGTFNGNAMTVRVSPERSSVGQVRAQGAADDFPADSFFDVFVEVEIAGFSSLLINLVPVRVEAQDLQKLPPLFDTYVHPPPQIALVAQNNPSGPVIGTIAGASSHRPVQDPTFGLASGGSLDAATLYELPTPPAVALSRTGLGLQPGDDLDALSFGTDGIDVAGATTLAFSVDANAVGLPNTGVAQQAALGRQEGAEFVTMLAETNQTLVPAAAIMPLPDTDDLDSLTDYPASVVDFDSDGDPEDPVFFSLAPGSPTLAALSASPADVLVTVNGSVSVFATASALGLTTGDDLDALCLMKSALPTTTLRAGSTLAAVPAPGPLLFDLALFSLAPGSPRLAAQGHSAGDLFVTNFSNSRPNLASAPLALYADASDLGLTATDDVDALKCLRPVVMFEIDGRGDLDGPGNATGCGDPGGDVDVAVIADVGPVNTSANELAAPSAVFGDFDFWELWTAQNPAVGDYHGPYAYPGTDAAAFAALTDAFEILDPGTDVLWAGGPGDNCGRRHIHTNPFGFPGDKFGVHLDPDVAACGHGVFVPMPFPIATIPTRRDVPTTAQLLVALFGNYFVALLPTIDLSWHRYDGPSTIVDATDCGQDPEATRAVLIVEGLNLLQVNFTLAKFGLLQPPSLAPRGAASGTVVQPPIRIGPARSTFASPLFTPEPGTTLAALAATGALALLARRRR
jgi:hypothetical protein